MDTQTERHVPDEAGRSGPRHSELSEVVQRNIQTLLEFRRTMDKKKSFEETFADRITGFTGSMLFVYIHATLFGGWLLVNTGVVPGVRPFDPFPFVMLAMIASVEAIFLSTFVLISQNRMAVMADQRADLDLQVNLLAEHEITRLIKLVDLIAQRVGVREDDPQLEELKKDVRPEIVLQEIDRMKEANDK